MPTAPGTFRPVKGPVARVEGDRARGSASARGYGRRWQKAAASFLARHPVCACGQDDCQRPATEVDHIVPHRGDERMFWDETNWQGLTKACHSMKTGRGQ